jgi:hypothetical protein
MSNPSRGVVTVIRAVGVLGLGVLLVTAGCRTAPPLPKVDLSAPGWSLKRGQAVWKPAAARPEIAGELLLATHRDGDCFVQFSKIPFSIVTAQVSAGRWRIEFGNQERTAAGRGPAPGRLGWFQLAPALAGHALPLPWVFESQVNGNWRLENGRTGEWLEGGFLP